MIQKVKHNLLVENHVFMCRREALVFFRCRLQTGWATEMTLGQGTSIQCQR